MIEAYKVEAAYAVYGNAAGGVGPDDSASAHKARMRAALEAAENAKPPEEMVVTEEMRLAGQCAVSKEYWQRSGPDWYRCAATAAYRAMHALAPEPAPKEDIFLQNKEVVKSLQQQNAVILDEVHRLRAKPAPPTVTDDAVDMAIIEWYKTHYEAPELLPASRRCMRRAITAALKVMFPGARPKVREPESEEWTWCPDCQKSYPIKGSAHGQATGDKYERHSRSGKDRRLGTTSEAIRYFGNYGKDRRFRITAVPDRRKAAP